MFNDDDALIGILRKTVCRTQRAKQNSLMSERKLQATAPLPCECGEDCVRQSWCMAEAQQVLAYAREVIERPTITTR